MIRITFIVGAGKLSRQKYDAKAMQTLTSSLRELDYVEDRGAGCSFDCAGCFKTQHDTGKNLFTVVVFPKIKDSSSNNSAGASNDANNNYGEDEPLLPANSPGYKIAVCSISTFQTLLSTHCPTYAQKRKCMECIEGLIELLHSIENKLMGGHPLDSAEQSLYDEMEELKEKLVYTQKEAAKHVDEGMLTLQEKEMLIEMNQKRVAVLMKEKSTAAVAEKLKKALARKEHLQSLKDDDVSSLSSSYPPPLRHEAKITALRKKLLPLQVLEGKAKGGFLTLAETRALTEKDEIESEIEQLEEASYGWFEEEDAFEARLQRSRDKFNAKFGKKGGGGKSSSSSSTKRSTAGRSGGGNNNVNKWILPGQKQQNNAWGTSGGKKKGGKGGGAVFAAMMMDSDSSSSEEEEDDDNDESFAKTNPTPAIRAVAAGKRAARQQQHPGSSNFIKVKSGGGQQSASTGEGDNKRNDTSRNDNIAASQSTTTAAPSKSKSKNKKKKKNKTKQNNNAVEESQGVGDGNAETATLTNKPSDDAAATISSSLAIFWQSFLHPFLSFIISLFMSLLSGLFGGGEKKKGGSSKKKNR